MFSRRLFLVCLTLVILARGWHCVCGEAPLPPRVTSAADAPALPESDDQQNDSGCLCKGAIYPTAPLWDSLLDLGCKWEAAAELALPNPTADLATLAPLAALLAAEPLAPPSALELRAVLASWQI